MKILFKKALRDMWRAKLRTLAIIIAIMISVGCGIGLVNATRDVLNTYDQRLVDTHYEDVAIQFQTDGLNLSEIEAIPGVESAMGRLLIKAQVEVDGEKFECHWMASPFYDQEPYSKVNGYQLNSGGYVSSSGARECVAGYLFADYNDLGEGDTVTVEYLNFSIPLEVTGIASSPEYLYVISDSGWPQPYLLLPIFTSYEMAAEVLNITPGHYNELLIIAEDGEDVNEVKQRVEAYMLDNGYLISQSITGTKEADYQFSRADAEGMGQVGVAFGTIIMFVTAVVIYNTMNRLVASQRTYIGVMGALGGRTFDILLHYSLFGLVMGAAGSILGLFAGIGLSIGAVKLLTMFLGIPTAVYSLDPVIVLSFMALGIGISFIGSLLGSVRLVKIGPREALSSAYVTQSFSKKPLIEKALGPSIGRKILYRVPIRNLARQRIRTGVTILAIGVSLILIFASLTMFLNMIDPIERNYEEYETWDVKVLLAERMDTADVYSRLNHPSFDGLRTEPMLDDYLPVEHKGKLKFIHIQAFPENSTLRNYHVIEGKEDFRNGKILVGSLVAEKLDITPGDEVPFKIGGFNITLEVSGITGELMDDSVFFTLELIQTYLGLAALSGALTPDSPLSVYSNATNALIVDASGMSDEVLEELMGETFPVASYQYSSDVKEGIMSLLNSLIFIFFIFIGFGILAEVLFISTTIVLNILDREPEFVSLRTMGAGPTRIRLMVVIENLLLFGAGVVVGIPISILATRWAIWYTTKDLMYLDISAGPEVYVVTILIALATTIVASYISAIHITKLKLADIIRQKLST